MPSQRRNERTPAKLGQTVEKVMVAGGHARAAEAIRSLRNKIVHFSVSDPADSSRTTYAEFDLPMSEPIINILSLILAHEQERYAKLKDLSEKLGPKPSSKVLTALEELEQAGSWFKTKEDLFRALEAPAEE